VRPLPLFAKSTIRTAIDILIVDAHGLLKGEGIDAGPVSGGVPAACRHVSRRLCYFTGDGLFFPSRDGKATVIWIGVAEVIAISH
jgi:hypothetical protein